MCFFFVYGCVKCEFCHVFEALCAVFWGRNCKKNSDKDSFVIFFVYIKKQQGENYGRKSGRE